MIITLGISVEAWACSCSIGGVKEKYDNHISIFEGKVSEIIYYDLYDSWGDQYIKVKFKTIKLWKGASNQNELLTVYNRTSCYGYWFKENQNYIIYAFEEEDHLNTWWCGGVISEKASSKEYTREIKSLNKLANEI
ncbi:MAG: hypothetical protein JKY19_08240 [Alcanivoracaceae bacterium]|nr:hypothetical protein [Alcanivoracaceae bacterium]